MDLHCTVCSEPYVPTPRGPSGMCPDCFQANFAGASPPLGWSEVETPALTLTPRQVQALARITRRAQEEEP